MLHLDATPHTESPTAALTAPTPDCATVAKTTVLVGPYRALAGVGEGKLLEPSAVPAYVWAGNATFTVVSPKTGTRYTYKVSAPRRDKTGRPYKTRDEAVAQGMRFVSVEDGGGHYLGCVYRQDAPDTTPYKYTHSAKSRLAFEDGSVKAVKWFLENLNRLPPSLEVWHLGRCGRCGRKLTVPESLSVGLGPDCLGSQSQKA